MSKHRIPEKIGAMPGGGGAELEELMYFGCRNVRCTTAHLNPVFRIRINITAWIRIRIRISNMHTDPDVACKNSIFFIIILILVKMKVTFASVKSNIGKKERYKSKLIMTLN